MLTTQLYFLSDQYYADFPDNKLMKNREAVDGVLHNRPCFFAFPDTRNADVVKNAKDVLAIAKRGAKVVFPDIFVIYSGLERQLQSKIIK